jgi:hypothetical protein
VEELKKYPFLCIAKNNYEHEKNSIPFFCGCSFAFGLRRKKIKKNRNGSGRHHTALFW